MSDIQIIQGDCLEVMKQFDDNQFDLVLTSPPYDNLRQYNGFEFYVDYQPHIVELERVLKCGGVCVWVVADQIVDGGESGSSFKQALSFMDNGFLLYDTMIYHRQAGNPPTNRYWQNFEYMFVFSKGKPKTTNIIRDRKNKYRKMGGDNVRQKDGTMKKGNRGGMALAEYGIRENIWYYGVGKGNTTDCEYAFQHPAMFPEKLAVDHIKSWSNEGNTVLDPFSGAGTTATACERMGRNCVGIEISEEYCEIARKRVQEEKDKMGLFNES